MVLAKHETAPWWRFLRELKHVGATVGILIVLLFLWFYICVRHVGTIKSALIILRPFKVFLVRSCNQNVKLSGHLHPVSKLRMWGVTPLLHLAYLWHAGQLSTVKTTRSTSTWQVSFIMRQHEDLCIKTVRVLGTSDPSAILPKPHK